MAWVGKGGGLGRGEGGAGWSDLIQQKMRNLDNDRVAAIFITAALLLKLTITLRRSFCGFCDVPRTLSDLTSFYSYRFARFELTEVSPPPAPSPHVFKAMPSQHVFHEANYASGWEGGGDVGASGFGENRAGTDKRRISSMKNERIRERE
jgi:hypothetical protein